MKASRILIVFATILMALPAFAEGIRTICKQGSDERAVIVVYSNPEKKVPCEVQYSKATEEKILYRYQNQVGQCELKMREFSEKLVGMGFKCDEGI